MRYPNNWANAATALTHPEIFRRSFWASGPPFETVTGAPFIFDDMWTRPDDEELTDEIQNYLHDQERAGRYFVDAGMYATLCLQGCPRFRHIVS